ncbi:MAG: DNA-binding response regulator [Bacteroidetes bacterium QS_9_68_14]|nr:MAG: DNA-binding response regulator [Bacteroidetes bacterium QS_9_68_14]
MSAASPRRVLIVDDHPVVRRGFRQLVEEQADLTVAEEAATPDEALQALGDERLDLALVDVALEGGAQGLDVVRQIRKTCPEAAVLTVSMHDERLYAHRALMAGAHGYVTKRVADEEMLRAMRQVLGGELYLSDSARERLAEDVPEARAPAADGEAATPVDQFTDRELEVFLLVGRGLAPRHIAERLHLSVKTVESHRRNVRQKLGLESAAEVMRYAVAWRVERGGAS